MCSIYAFLGVNRDHHSERVGAHASNDEHTTLVELVHHPHLRSQGAVRTQRTNPSRAIHLLPVRQGGEVLENQVPATGVLIDEVDELLLIDEVRRIEVLANHPNMELALFAFRTDRNTARRLVSMPCAILLECLSEQTRT